MRATSVAVSVLILLLIVPGLLCFQDCLAAQQDQSVARPPAESCHNVPETRTPDSDMLCANCPTDDDLIKSDRYRLIVNWVGIPVSSPPLLRAGQEVGTTERPVSPTRPSPAPLPTVLRI